ncbi:DUF4245 domain-containing protein [Thermoactinospora rubra]|uniref:DUF4245 domain-containing protein n=1 Tax=Thermoactinospora rubra TaxID=1088767 RepID=UPI000A115C94|nr:DUF4245 domain-containing protein [Thermoactinospora rubra]
MRRFTEGFYGYVFAVLVCVALVGVWWLVISPRGGEEHIPRRDYSITVANFSRAVPYQVWAPAQDPKGWIPNSNKIAKGVGGAQVLHLGYATASRQHAMLIQSNEQPPAEFANRMTNTNRSVGAEQIGGQTWERRFREDKKQRSLVRMLPDVTLIVTGTADWPELAQLAAALQQRPKPAS